MVKLGESMTVQRTFTHADVADFTRVSEDRGPWHTTPDAQGRLVVHGLATVALTTKMGGALGFMARRFEIDFLAPVFTGDTLTCVMTITELSAAPHAVLGAARKPATRLAADAVITNQRGAVVARVAARGVIPKPLAEVEADDPRARL